jgi:hypothetical protein
LISLWCLKRDTDQGTSAGPVPILRWVNGDVNRQRRTHRNFWTFWSIFRQSSWTDQNRGRLSVTQPWSFCCPIPW